jgi:ketosteroid isomerase-like protein
MEREPAVEVASAGEADVAAIEGLLAEYARAVNSKDLEGILSCFLDEGVMMPPNAPALAGPEALRARFAPFAAGLA